MQIRAGYEITFNCPYKTPMLLMISVHPERAGDMLTPGLIRLTPDVQQGNYIDAFGNRCTRILAPPGLTTVATDFTIADSGLPDEVRWDAAEMPVEDLPDEMLVFLLGSRYCETDRLSDAAWSLFGNTPRGWGRVQAICNFVHNHIRFDYNMADSTRTAWDAYQGGHGVCRDFAHLAVAFCRCMNIPARYCTGYLGDIGMPPPYAPGDFSAWFEVFLGGRWYTFDARHNMPRIGRVLMARGRDATDVAISSSFGRAPLAGFLVFTDEVV